MGIEKTKKLLPVVMISSILVLMIPTLVVPIAYAPYIGVRIGTLIADGGSDGDQITVGQVNVVYALYPTPSPHVHLQFYVYTYCGAWRMTALQIDVKTSVTAFPQANGNPKVGKLAVNVKGFDTTTWGPSVVFDNIPQDTNVYIAVHAEVYAPDWYGPGLNRYEGAWAIGYSPSSTGQFTGKNWATYIIYHTPAPASCPFLYTWNGKQYTFVSDMYGGGLLTRTPQPEDYVKIESSQLKSKDGSYTMQIVQEYDEISYLDRLYLTTVDHSAGVDVYPSLLRAEKEKIYTVGKNLASPISAVDEDGKDVLQQIISKDDIYTSGRPYELDLLVLDLGDLSDAEQIKLVLTGYTSWIPGAYPVGLPNPTARFIEVKDVDGNWVTILKNSQISHPAARPRTYVLDLTGKFLTDDYSVRIGFMADVRFDYVAVDTSPQQAIIVNTINPASADLHFRGYSKVGAVPQIPDYYTFSVTPPKGYSQPSGDFTRYGDVQPLLTETDDMFIIMHHGDEISVNFDSTTTPEGMERSFFLYAWGYYKNTYYAAGGTVEPLPFKGMSTYPYPVGESYPYDPEHIAYIDEYNTRHYD